MFLTSYNISFAQNQYTNTPIYPSVSMFHQEDFEQCSKQLDVISSKNIKGVNFVINKYVNLNGKALESYCYRDSQKNCKRLNSKIIYKFTKDLKKCFDIAKSKNMEITILPHIDDHNDKLWRNIIRFHPLKSYANYNYLSAFITPIINALGNYKKTYFNLTGEMGNSIFNHAYEYIKIVKLLRTMRPNYKIGIGLNFNQINGGADLNKDKRYNLKKLIESLDFIGFSAYKGIKAYKGPKQFEDAIWDFLKELKSFKVQIPKGKEIHFSEIAIGGGASKYDGKTRATKFSEALGSPYSGIHTIYNKTTDPWQIPEVKRARHIYYEKLFHYLKNKKQYNLKRAYLWNVGSWDFLSIYPGTYGYEDYYLIRLLLEHNQSILYK